MKGAAIDPRKGYRAGELDFLSIVETVIDKQPRVLKNGLPNLAFFRAANAVLATPDDEADGHGFPQVELWLTLARDLGMVGIDGDRLAILPAADAFFALPFGERRDRMRDTFLNSRGLNDFALVNEIELPGLKKAGTVDVVTDAPDSEARVAARKRVLEFALASDGETKVARLSQLMQRTASSFAIDHSDDGSWRKVYYRGIRERNGREDVERDGGWERVEGAYIRWLIALPLARLGWVDYDAARDSFEALDGEEGEPSFEIIIQPNFEVLALGDRLDAGQLWRVARFTRPAMEGRVRRYMLEKKPFTEALGRGQNASALVALLTELSRKPLPQNVRFSLDEWGASSERMKIWPDALLIEAEGVEDLAALLPQTMRDKLGLARLAGGHFAGVAPDATTLRENLPPRRAVLDYSRRLPPVITPQQGLRLQAPSETLHLRARQLLELIAKRQSADYWLLDPALTRAASAALGPDELRKRVDEALTRPLENAHALALRGWSGEFAPAFAGNAELFLCEHEAQAELLEQVPDFNAWLDRKLGRGAYLLRQGGAAAVRKLLESYGIKLRDHSRRSS